VDNKYFVEEIKKITQKRMDLKNSYEKCCNDSELSLADKKDILINFEIAYGCLEVTRDKMLKNYMKMGGNH